MEKCSRHVILDNAHTLEDRVAASAAAHHGSSGGIHQVAAHVPEGVPFYEIHLVSSKWDKRFDRNGTCAESPHVAPEFATKPLLG